MHRMCDSGGVKGRNCAGALPAGQRHSRNRSFAISLMSSDLDRLALQVMAEVMGAEAALVRCQLVSGTHAIATALFACLRPGNRLLVVAGR